MVETKYAILAGIEFAKIRIRSPVRAIRRFHRRFMDDLIKDSEAMSMIDDFEEHTKAAIDSGDTENLKKFAGDFISELLKEVKGDEKAQVGIFFVIKNRLGKLHEFLTHVKKGLEENDHSHLEEAHKIKEDIKGYIHKALAELNDFLSKVEKLQLELSRGRTQVVDANFVTESGMKHALANTFSRIRSEEKAEDRALKEIEKDVDHHDEEKRIVAQLKIFLHAFDEEIKDIYLEMRYLVKILHDLLGSEENLEHKEIEDHLIRGMGLPEKVAQDIEASLHEDIIGHIRSHAETRFQMDKKLEQKERRVESEV